VLKTRPMRAHLLLVFALVLAVAGCGPSDSGPAGQPASPVANPAAAGVAAQAGSGLRLVKMDLGRSVNPDNTMRDATYLFIPADTVWVSVEVEGAGPRTTLQARWQTDAGAVLDQSSQEVTPGDHTAVAFHLARPDGWQLGKYKVDVLANGVAMGSKDFEVRQPPL